MENKAGPG
jgi:hypothetical protein